MKAIFQSCIGFTRKQLRTKPDHVDHPRFFPDSEKLRLYHKKIKKAFTVFIPIKHNHHLESYESSTTVPSRLQCA